MTNPLPFRLHLRRQMLARDERGQAFWQATETEQLVRPAELALLVCDMWDTHWSRGACERVDAMVPRMNQVLEAARARGAFIIHAPSDTMAHYAGTPARQRMLAVAHAEPPPPLEHPDPPLPVDDSDHGSDTGETVEVYHWSRQHPGLYIDQARDAIGDKGADVYSLLRARGIRMLAIMGVHTNMCILHRTFGIKQMVRWGVDVVLVRDLTDSLYNPARPPYVSHDEGTRLVVEFIEKHWCPSVSSEELYA